MKFIIRIQSIADLITNSSSEAFVMREDDAKYFESLPTNGCVDIYAITEETIRSEWYDGDLICNFLGIEPFDSWTSSVEEWNEFVDVYILCQSLIKLKDSMLWTSKTILQMLVK